MSERKNTYKALHLVKVTARDLKLGMYVAQLDRPWLETAFALQGFQIREPEDIQALRNICQYVYIDVLKTHWATPDIHATPLPGAESSRYEIRSPVEKEITPAAQAYDAGLKEVQNLLQGIYSGRMPPTKEVKKLVRACVDSIARNPSAMMWLSRIKHVDQYTAEHCLHVSILSVALGRHLGLERKQLEMLGLCGMLHDVGKMKVDQDILNKRGQLTTREYRHVQLHTVFGREVLREDKLLPPQVALAAYGHHERVDRNGYPEALPSSEVDFYSKVVSIADAYDAITSNRCYREARSSAEAIKILYDNAGTQFDAGLVVKFIECIGIYPAGSLVEMNTGEVGVVLSADPESRLQPKIALLLDANKKHMQQRVVDLRQESASGGHGKHTIRTVLADGAFGIDLEDYTRNNVLVGNQLSP